MTVNYLHEKEAIVPIEQIYKVKTCKLVASENLTALGDNI